MITNYRLVIINQAFTIASNQNANAFLMQCMNGVHEINL
jgi:hypothetical protein